MDHVKSRGRSKFFTCFSPVFSDDEFGHDSDSSVGKKKRARRSFAAAMKAVFFKSSSGKKSRKKKTKQDPFRSNSGYSSSSTINSKNVNTNKNPGEQISRANSNASSIFSPSITDSSRSSSRSSSMSSNSGSISVRMKQSASSLDLKQALNPQSVKRDGEKCGCIVEMCIFLVCLAALVFCGKVSAIVTCTSACLFFAPSRPHRRRSRAGSPAGSADLSYNDIIGSEEEKKRVIMQGLLERNRPRVLQP